MHHRTGMAEVNGARLYFECAGEGEALVLIHGHGLDTRMWDDQFLAFAAHFRVIRFDVRGFGQSTLPTSQQYSHVDDLNALLSHLQVSVTHVLGLSMGASIAIDFAVSHPEKTLNLILASGGASDTLPEEGFLTLSAVFEQAKTLGPKAANTAWLRHPLFSRASETPSVRQRLEQMVDEYSGWHWVNTNPLVGPQPPAVKRLREISAPTLVILGEYEERYVFGSVEVLKQEIPTLQVAIIRGAGHMVNMESPEAFNQIVLSFLVSATRS